MEFSTDRMLSWDEVKMHVDGRYVSAPDAVWRIFGKPLQGRSHTIVDLHVHDEAEKVIADITAEETAEAEDAAEENSAEAEAADVFVTDGSALPEPRAAPKSTLLAWFKLNEAEPAARNCYYYQVPEFYRWNKRKGVFVPRKRNSNALGRIFNINPANSDLHHLRLLLLHVKGATCYADLRTFNGRTYASYAEACVARKLTFDDTEWQKCMKEAAQWKMPVQLREFFASILAHCSPKFPFELWTTFKVCFFLLLTMLKTSI